MRGGQRGGGGPGGGANAGPQGDLSEIRTIIFGEMWAAGYRAVLNPDSYPSVGELPFISIGAPWQVY